MSDATDAIPILIGQATVNYSPFANGAFLCFRGKEMFLVTNQFTDGDKVDVLVKVSKPGADHE